MKVVIGMLTSICDVSSDKVSFFILYSVERTVIKDLPAIIYYALDPSEQQVAVR